MKNILVKWIGVIVVILGCVVAHCDGLSEEAKDEPCKTIELPEHLYLNIEQISFVDSKIYINIHDIIYETTAVFSDKKGLYIQTINSKCTGECKWFHWQCKRCGFCNLYELECGLCNAPKAYYKCK
jgi:hypothetical protein